MNDERVVEEIVTKFLLNTCRLSTKLSSPAVGLQAAGVCAEIAAEHLPNDVETDYIKLTTGSVAEFYIEPIIPHIGDIDVMFHSSTQLAIPAGHPPPTQLPDEFHNYVKVLEIVDSHLPGYVYLKLRYLLSECIDDSKYNAIESDVRRFLQVYNIYSGLKGYDIHQLTPFPAYVVSYGRQKPLIGQHDTETTAGQVQQLLIVLSAMDVMWFRWHIVSVDNMN